MGYAILRVHSGSPLHELERGRGWGPSILCQSRVQPGGGARLSSTSDNHHQRDMTVDAHVETDNPEWATVVTVSRIG